MKRGGGRKIDQKGNNVDKKGEIINEAKNKKRLE